MTKKMKKMITKRKTKKMKMKTKMMKTTMITMKKNRRMEFDISWV